MAKSDTVVSAVGCTFYDHTRSLIIEQDVKIETGLGARMVACRHGCETVARLKGYPLFAVPGGLDGDAEARWIVFRMRDNFAEFVKVWPNRAAADMWMQLNG